MIYSNDLSFLLYNKPYVQHIIEHKHKRYEVKRTGQFINVNGKNFYKNIVWYRGLEHMERMRQKRLSREKQGKIKAHVCWASGGDRT